MIEADRHVTGVAEPGGRGLELGRTLRRPRQRALVDQTLMALHPGHMRVAEQRNPRGAQPQRRLDRLQDAATV